MADVKRMAWGTVVDTERDGSGQRMRVRLATTQRPDERGRVHISVRGTSADAEAKQVEVFGYITPDDAVALAEQLLRHAGLARRGRRV